MRLRYLVKIDRFTFFAVLSFLLVAVSPSCKFNSHRRVSINMYIECNEYLMFLFFYFDFQIIKLRDSNMYMQAYK